MSASKPVNLTPEQREHARKYVLDRIAIDANGCWIWQRNKLHAGHGQAKIFGWPMKAHRLSYAVFVGEPGELAVCHRCDVPSCVNYEHLFLGTKGDNNKDASMKGRYMLRSIAVLTDEMCHRAFRLRMERKTVPAIATELGVGYDVIRALLAGDTHPHIARPDGYVYGRAQRWGGWVA